MISTAPPSDSDVLRLIKISLIFWNHRPSKQAPKLRRVLTVEPRLRRMQRQHNERPQNCQWVEGLKKGARVGSRAPSRAKGGLVQLPQAQRPQATIFVSPIPDSATATTNRPHHRRRSRLHSSNSPACLKFPPPRHPSPKQHRPRSRSRLEDLHL